MSVEVLAKDTAITLQLESFLSFATGMPCEPPLGFNTIKFLIATSPRVQFHLFLEVRR